MTAEDTAAPPASGPLETPEQMYAAFEELSIEGGWHRRAPALWDQPARTLLPHRWSYADIKPVLAAAGRMVDHTMADRRNVTLRNPAEGNLYATVRTLVAAYQLIRPGEAAKAHRHTPAALRIILEGHGTYTVVEGTRVEMRPGDVLLTPSWMWHSHSHAGVPAQDCYWVDVLDVPLVHLLEPMFFERYPGDFEPNPVDADTASVAFRWEDTVAALAQAPAPLDGMSQREHQLGDPALRTVALHAQWLSAGFTSATRQTTASSVFTVVRGSGHTVVDGTTLTWTTGDVVAVPAWRPYAHTATEDSYLVRASDEPVLSALGLLRSQPSPTAGA